MAETNESTLSVEDILTKKNVPQRRRTQIRRGRNMMLVDDPALQTRLRRAYRQSLAKVWKAERETQHNGDSSGSFNITNNAENSYVIEAEKRIEEKKNAAIALQRDLRRKKNDSSLGSFHAESPEVIRNRSVVAARPTRLSVANMGPSPSIPLCDYSGIIEQADIPDLNEIDGNTVENENINDISNVEMPLDGKLIASTPLQKSASKPYNRLQKQNKTSLSQPLTPKHQDVNQASDNDGTFTANNNGSTLNKSVPENRSTMASVAANKSVSATANKSVSATANETVSATANETVSATANEVAVNETYEYSNVQALSVRNSSKASSVRSNLPNASRTVNATLENTVVSNLKNGNKSVQISPVVTVVPIQGRRRGHPQKLPTLRTGRVEKSKKPPPLPLCSILEPADLIVPNPDLMTPGVRRSHRIRARTLRSYLGERLIYAYREGYPTIIGISKLHQNRLARRIFF